jgi:hypothetical protein
MYSDEQPMTVKAGLTVSRLIWPDFVEEHGCVFPGTHSGSNPSPANEAATGWESFVNHTHIFDEFAKHASTIVSKEVVYNEQVMQLMQKGVLNLDVPIQQYLPKTLPEHEKCADLQGDEPYKKLKLRILLSHSSGFPNFWRCEDDRMLKIHFEPGTRRLTVRQCAPPALSCFSPAAVHAVVHGNAVG